MYLIFREEDEEVLEYELETNKKESRKRVSEFIEKGNETVYRLILDDEKLGESFGLDFENNIEADDVFGRGSDVRVNYDGNEFSV